MRLQGGDYLVALHETNFAQVAARRQSPLPPSRFTPAGFSIRGSTHLPAKASRAKSWPTGDHDRFQAEGRLRDIIHRLGGDADCTRLSAGNWPNTRREA